MNSIQKEREAFEDWYIRNMDTNGDFEKISEQDSPYMDEHVNNSWLTWQAKAQAVPEGFVVVSQKDLLELTIVINAVDLATHTESKTNEVREMWQQVALKLMALGISQEPAND